LLKEPIERGTQVGPYNVVDLVNRLEAETRKTPAPTNLKNASAMRRGAICQAPA
jgi:hypothetical protein